jgi:assimilatory nitrate reductase catalytic subunit
MLVEAPRPLPEPTSDEYPFTLLTGRGSSAEWHTRTRTSKSAVLRRLGATGSYVEVSPLDARTMGIATNDMVSVVSRRATVTVRGVLFGK